MTKLYPNYTPITYKSSTTMSALFTLANGAQLRILSAKELVSIPVWKNNRIIDHDHVAHIRRTANPRTLDHNYHIAILPELDAGGNTIHERYIIDGQHRACILRNYFEQTLFAEDFPVVVYERRFETEGELIEYFNTVNNAKPVQPWLDENLILNNCIASIEEVFQNRKTRFIRPAGCYRPYLSAEKLREGLRAYLKDLPTTASGAKAFAERVKAWNDTACENDVYVLGIRAAQKREMFEKGVKLGFVLAYDNSNLPWIRETVLNN